MYSLVGFISGSLRNSSRVSVFGDVCIIYHIDELYLEAIGRVNCSNQTTDLMAARDVFHGAVRKGLEKDGWVNTDVPLNIRADEVIWEWRR